MVGPREAGHWTAPDGDVTITHDVLAVMDKFGNDWDAPSKTRCDVHGEIPDLLITMQDVLKVKEAFMRRPYPFEEPVECPPP